MASPQPVSLVTLGPKTNVAMLLIMYPDVAARLEQIIFMGGSASGGNVTAVAEFNVWQDPEAARCVIESSIPTTMYGFDLFGRLAVSQAVADRFRAHQHPAVRLAGELLYRRRVSSDDSAHDYVGLLGDAGAMVLLTNPSSSLPASSPCGSTRWHRPRADNCRSASRTQGRWARSCPWPRIAVAVDVDVAQAASTLVKTIDGYTARGATTT